MESVNRNRKSAAAWALVMAVMSGMMAQQSNAYTYTWNGPMAGSANWNNAANWTSSDGGTLFPNATGDVANFGVALTGSLTVNLNQAITIGTLNLASTNTNIINLNTGSAGGKLILDNTGTTQAAINVANSSTINFNYINANIELQDDLLLTHSGTINLYVTSIISGDKNIVKAGNQVTQFSGASTYTGSYTAREFYSRVFGDVLTDVAGPFGKSTQPIYLTDNVPVGAVAVFFGKNGDNFYTAPATTTVSRDINAASGDNLTSAISIRVIGATSTTNITGNIVFGTNGVGSGTKGRGLHLYTDGPEKILNVSGVISSTGISGNLNIGLQTVTSAGTIRLSNSNNSFTSETWIDAGRLWLAGDVPTSTATNSVLGKSPRIYLGNSNSPASGLTIEAIMDGAYTYGRELIVGQGTNTSSSSLVIGGNTADVSGFSGAIKQYDNGSSDRLARTLSIKSVSGGTVNVSGNITQNNAADTLNIRKIGAGTASLTGTNTYKGTTTVRSGTLEVSGDAALGSATSAISVGDATTVLTAVKVATFGTEAMTFDAPNNTLTNVPLSIDNQTLAVGDRVLVKDERNGGGTPVGIVNGIYRVSAIGSKATLVRVTELDSTAEATYGTQVSVTSGTFGGKSYFLGNANAVTLNTTPTTWTQDVANPDAVLLINTNSGLVSRNINIVGNNSTGTSTLGTSITSGTATFSGGIALGRHAQLSAASGGQVDITGVIDDSANSFGLTKVGGGMVNLTNANTFDGGFAVTEGLLKVNNTIGSATGTGSVSVASGAALGGAGAIAGSVTVLGELAAGNSIGTITVGGLTIGDGGKITIELGAAGLSDQIVVNGNIDLSSLLDSVVFTGTPDLSMPYVIATYTGTLTGTFDSIINLPTSMGLTYGSGQIKLEAIPEPASLTLLALGSVMVSGRRRK